MKDGEKAAQKAAYMKDGEKADIYIYIIKWMIIEINRTELELDHTQQYINKCTVCLGLQL